MVLGFLEPAATLLYTDYRESGVKGRRPLGGYCSNPERDGGDTRGF